MIPNWISDDRPQPVLPFTGQWEIESVFYFYLELAHFPSGTGVWANCRILWFLDCVSLTVQQTLHLSLRELDSDERSGGPSWITVHYLTHITYSLIRVCVPEHTRPASGIGLCRECPSLKCGGCCIASTCQDGALAKTVIVIKHLNLLERQEGWVDNNTLYSCTKRYTFQSHLNVDYLILTSEQPLLSPFDRWGKNGDTKNLSLAQGHRAN